MPNLLEPGTIAPDFMLHVTPDQKLSLSELRGRPVILAFYPADWSPVCGDQMALYNEVRSEFQKFNAELIGISVDGVWCHAQFASDRHLHFPLLADFEPKGAVARAYGAYREADGFTERALFVIDAQGKIAWSYCSPVGVNPVPTASSKRLKILQKTRPSKGAIMSMLKTPVSSKDHIQGDPHAPIILVEYGDYQCPHCGHAYPIVKRVQKHLGSQLAFVFRNFPLREAHPDAELAAETAEFAGAHDRFWQMHDALFENQENLGLPLVLELAQTLKLPADQLESALTDGTYADRVQTDFSGGVRSGVNGTPTFFINGHRHDGPFEFEDLI